MCLYFQAENLLYRDTAVPMVTPLRDGVSLVAKEFVACQIKDDGVPILSQFAGSDTEMREAIVVNPFDIEKTTRALQTALMAILHQRESSQNIFIWTELFLTTLEIFPYQDFGSKKEQHIQIPPSIENFYSYRTNCIYDCSKLVVILDYDTLLPHLNCNPPQEILSEEMRGVLKRLTTMQNVNMALVSSCSLKRIHDTYAGEYGFEILHTDGTKFITQFQPNKLQASCSYKSVTGRSLSKRSLSGDQRSDVDIPLPRCTSKNLRGHSYQGY